MNTIPLFNYQPFAPGLIRILTDIVHRNPMLFVEAILTARIQLQSMFTTSAPLVMTIRTADKSAPVPRTTHLPVNSWLSCDPVTHGLLTMEGEKLKLIHLDQGSSPVVLDARHMSTAHAAEPTTVTQSAWLGLDLHSFVYLGTPVVTMCEGGGGEIPPAWTNAIDDAKVLFRRRFEGYKSKASCDDFRRHTSLQQFESSLSGLPIHFAKAMDSLADELAWLSWMVTQEIFAYDRSSSCNTLWGNLAQACVDSLVPGVGSLVFHGFGWPNLHLYGAKSLLGKIRNAGWVPIAKILRFERTLNAASRDEILDYLNRRGAIKVNDKMVCAVEPIEFFRAQARNVGSVALAASA